jgi:hypothetical protein
METHDRVALWIICILLLSTLTFGISYFYLWSKYSRQTENLKFCTETYNDLSWQYFHNCTKLNCTETDYPNYSPSPNLYWANDSIYSTNNYKQEFYPKCFIETKVIYHHTWLEGGMEYYQTCLRCADLNQSIAPGVLENGEWMCPADTYY